MDHKQEVGVQERIHKQEVRVQVWIISMKLKSKSGS